MKNLLRYFFPMENGDGTSPPPPPPPPPAAGSPDARPDWCQEKFYDPELGAGIAGVRSEVMANAYTELEGKLRTGKDAYKAEIDAERIAAMPETYEITLPKFEDGEVPEGVEITLKPDDPIAEWFMGYAKENGLSQEQFSSAVEGYIRHEVSKLPDMTKEIAKLGDYGQDRLQRVSTWLEKSLSPTHLEALKPLMQSATSIEALEFLQKGHKPGDFDGETGKALTLEELQTMQNDPKAWRDKDPAHLKKISEGFKRLFPQ